MLLWEIHRDVVKYQVLSSDKGDIKGDLNWHHNAGPLRLQDGGGGVKWEYQSLAVG